MTAVPNATILTPAQIAYYAQTAGFDGEDLTTAVAIALAESSGNPNVYNPETSAPGGTPAGQGSYGLWQIYLKEHPEFAADNLYDPQTNANDAYEIYGKAGGFSPWASYNSGAYQAFMGAASSAGGQGVAIPGLTPEGQAAPSGGFSLNEFLWIGAAVLVGWALFSFLE